LAISLVGTMAGDAVRVQDGSNIAIELDNLVSCNRFTCTPPRIDSAPCDAEEKPDPLRSPF
jgi:hypothetical protein